MNITAILIAVAVVGGVGLFLGLFLGVAGILFKVEVDEKEEAVLGVLPGNNCGGCGYPGCSGLAAAIAKGEAAVNACPVGGEAVGKQIAEIMGVEAGESVRMTAFVKCAGTCEKTTQNYEYSGLCNGEVCSGWWSKVMQPWLSWIWKLRKGLSFWSNLYSGWYRSGR